MSLGERIVELRKSKGISQELLAENAKVSLRTIQRIEVGDSIPRLYTLKVIADVFGVTVEYLNPPNQMDSLPQEVELIKLRQINLCGLAAFIPFMNIIIPLVMWSTNRKFHFVNALGRRVVSFQILWTLMTVLFLILTRFVQVGLTGSVAIGRFPPTIFVMYFLLFTANFIVVIREAGKLKKEASGFYSFVPALF